VGKVRETLSLWAGDPARRKAAEEGAARFSRPDAAAEIIRSALRELGKGEAGGV
jgi:UDP-N-acetylglucosamine:LPS N-acetylglucosamine transferase